MNLNQAIRIAKEKFPWIKMAGLSGDQVRGIAAGELVPVRIQRRGYELWKDSDLTAGKLDQVNQEIKARNWPIGEGSASFAAR
jgi:hypothetical protein